MDAQSAFDPTPGVAGELEPGLRRVVAPNPSPMTYRGTNTYLVGTGGIAVIDPGPDDTRHLEAILAALRPGQHVSHILVTHAHVDHSPLAPALKARTGAQIWAFGDAGAGRSTVMQGLAARGLAGGGEGVDAAFAPDHCVGDGETITGDGWTLEAIHTPGHFGNHLSFGWNDACFTGDHVMGWASSLVSPPDGDLSDFMASCVRLAMRDWRIFHPGHGAPVTDPSDRLRWLVEHRRNREADILHALEAGPARAYDLSQRIYIDTPPSLLGAATRNVFAHLVDLVGKRKARPLGELESDALFERI